MSWDEAVLYARRKRSKVKLRCECGTCGPCGADIEKMFKRLDGPRRSRLFNWIARFASGFADRGE